MNRLSLKLAGLRDQEEILEYTMTEVPRLSGAESCLLWPWDADQQAPTMMVAPQMRTISFPFSASLLSLFRQVCLEGRAHMTEPEDALTWPPELIATSVIFVPLLTQQGCLGILSVHHFPGERFTQDDLLLLSALGNLVATVLLNAQLYANERHPVSLLLTAIRQVVQATTGRLDHYEEFLHSLLQVGEGLTRAEAVCAYVELEERQAPLTGTSGTLAGSNQAELQLLARELMRLQQQHLLPPTGMLGEIVVPSGGPPEGLSSYYYACEDIPCRGKVTGIIYALKVGAFSTEQLAFLRTIAEQVGMGISNMQQSANIARLLIEMSNVSYVAEDDCQHLRRAKNPQHHQSGRQPGAESPDCVLRLAGGGRLAAHHPGNPCRPGQGCREDDQTYL